MKTTMKKTITTTLAAIVAVLITTTAVQAIATLTPQGTVGDDTQYTTNNIFNKLTDFTVSATEGTGAISLPGSVTATFNTLSEIYALLKAEEDDLVPEKILAGTTVFGVEGTVIEGLAFPTQWSETNPAGSVDVDWDTAREYCDDLTENGGGWRLPTYLELVNAYLTSNPGNTLGFQLVRYWSSTEYPFDSSLAYLVNMNNGFANLDIKATPNSLARCVR